ncbi:hypothetical protein ACGYLL_19745 [Sulfitobacter sp. M23905]|uniref:hypothetical protein n=1 Tax=Sulfitobacter sp. M23905 TaxID=3368578 RepID=UPI0037473779
MSKLDQADSEMLNLLRRPEVTAAVIAGFLGLLIGYLGFRADDRRTDAEFARIALSILAVDSEKQNVVAREIAMEMLSVTLPVQMTEDQKSRWLTGPSVNFDLPSLQQILEYRLLMDKNLGIQANPGGDISGNIGPLQQRPFENPIVTDE